MYDDPKLSATTTIYPVSNSSSLTDVHSMAPDADTEKGEVSCKTNGASLTSYVVPVLDKGVKTALKKPTSPWVRFRVWYNPYRMVNAYLKARIRIY